MAEEQKPIAVEAPKVVEETPAPIVAEPTKEETPAPATTTEAAAPVTETTEDKPAEAVGTEETKTEEAKEEAKPIEEGHLSHKAQGLSFPKNLIPTKEFFFFGTDAFEPKTLATYQRTEKSVETAQSNIAWASETGNGLLFIGDKKNPTGLINLSDASEPVIEGTHKFTVTSKGNKHSFKAANTAERDNWVAQLKLKIAEAKELATTIVETENYKKTIESFKPAVPAKDEKPVEAPKEEVTPTEEAPKAEEPVKEEVKAEEKAESPKPSKSKRASFFNFIKKDEPKEEKKEIKPEEAKPTEEVKPEETPAPVEAAKPVEETPKVEETPAAPEAAVVATEAPKEEEKPVDEAKPAESPREKATKRNSFFGNVFSKKEKKAVEAKPVEAAETPKEEEVPATTETAPVIPPVESTTPLAVDVSTPATVPTETTEATPVTGEIKKDPKEKRKSSLPFLGKREKSPSPANGEERSKSPFSKLRATIRGKTTPKAEDKPAEEAAKEEATEVKPEDKPAEEPLKEEPIKAVQPEAETKPENVAATTTPAVTAAA